MTRRDGLAIEVARFWSAATIAAAAGPGPLVLAVSGGADSLALLHVLRELAPDMGISLHVAHLDHGMRGADAAGDAAFVSASCAAWGVPCTLTTFDVPGYAARGGLSAEDAARRARYSFLAAVAGEVGAAAVATGHHADDQVETVVGHWLRGAGPTGLGGMAAWGPLSLPPDAPALALALGLTLPVAPVVLLRPLLAVWRAEILAYCAAVGLHPREDASNADVSYRRNHLRHNLLPALEREQPGLAHRLWHSAAVFRDEDALVEGLLDARWSQVAGMDASGVRLDLTAFVALPAALQRRALRRAAQVMAGSLQGLASSHIEDARILLGPAGRTGGAVHWPHGLQVRRERDAAIVEACPPSTDPRWPSVTPGDLIELPSEGVCALGAGFVLQIRQERWTAAQHMPADPGPWSAWFDADVLTAQAARPVVRTRRPGDRMRPLGAGGHTRKLQDVLVDGGVPRHLRDSLALLASHDGEVLWVPGPGGRRSVIAPVTPQTERVIIYSLVRTGEVAG